MGTMTIRAIDDDLKARLRIRAAEHGRSMEAEVRSILAAALADEPARPLGSRIHERFAELDLAEFSVPERVAAPRRPDLGG